MSFLDDLGQKIGDFGENAGAFCRRAAAKTEDQISAAKLRSAIRTQERILSGTYENIGRRYCEQKAEENDPAFSEDLEKIRSAKEEIRRLGEELSALVRTKRCPNCGHENAASAKFCSSCGCSLQDTEKSGNGHTPENTAEESDFVQDDEQDT